jgi:type IV secretion system protein VirB11
MMTRFLGSVVMQAFEESDVTEVYTNPQEQRIWLIKHSNGRVDSGARLDASNVLAALNTVATTLRATVRPEIPSLQAELPLDRFRRSRLQGLVPPLTAGPRFVIREHALAVYSLDDYVEQGLLAALHADVIRQAVRERWNVLVIGGARTGTTTFANRVLHEIARACPDERIVLLEDTVELQCEAEDHVALRTAAGGTLADLVRCALRLSPDRIVVSEVRDPAALSMLDAWQPGHPGSVATLHATSTEGALLRLDLLCQWANVPSQLHLIADAVQLIVHMRREYKRPRVVELVRVRGLDPPGRFRLQRFTHEAGDAAAVSAA